MGRGVGQTTNSIAIIAVNACIVQNVLFSDSFAVWCFGRDDYERISLAARGIQAVRLRRMMMSVQGYNARGHRFQLPGLRRAAASPGNYIEAETIAE